MPTVIANALLALAPDSSLPVRGSDRVGVASPMFNEAAGAAAALGSLLTQTEQVDQLAVSVNGGTDDTMAVVRATLLEHGFAKVYGAPAPDFAGNFERWHRDGNPAVVVLEHALPISKADSINAIIAGEYLSTERVLVVDGDTIFAPTFVERLKDEFYRLKREKVRGRWRYVIEDSALQSGAVMSLRPSEGSAAASHISAARSGEYAVAALLRAGQTARIGKGALLGRSRLYTVVGCGFAARRSSFPMPADTLTEDHDFTLRVQNEETTEHRLTVADLQARGFQVRSAAGLVAVADYFDAQDEVVLRRGANARFATGALMYTEDPLNLPGYMQQVERWNGGGVENAIKRARRQPGGRLKPNVSFAAFSAQFENLFGIALLLFLLPVALGINSALPGYGTALSGLAAWLGLDLVVTLALVGFGFRRLWRHQGERGWRLFGRTAGSTLGSAVPLLSMRLFNAVSYVVAFTRVAPRALGKREVDPRTTITWERPRAVVRNQLGMRVTTVSLGLTLGAAALFVASSFAADAYRPGYKATWHLINTGTPLVAEEYVDLPIMTVVKLVEPITATPVLLPDMVDGEPGAGSELRGATVDLEARQNDDLNLTHYLSAFCSVGFTATPASERRSLSGDAGLYQPLTYWQRLVLARLVPLAAHLEEAATAYDVPTRLLLQILINESFLDPLAVGPTEDLGLSQVTGDALTLLRSISTQPRSQFANGQLFAGPFSVFDPDFSICAGAAKLAWSRAQPNGTDDRFAYARYINPLEGVQRNSLNPVHAELVVALDGLVETVDALRNTFAAYEQDPAAVTSQERALLDVYALVADGELGLGSAYLMVRSLVSDFGIDDDEFYLQITDRLYGAGSSTVSLPTQY